jgi:deoxyribose-phosphate aldolase
MVDTFTNATIEIQAIDFFTPVKQAIIVAGEHGFGAVSVVKGRLEQAVETKRSIFEGQEDFPKIISVIDYPFGANSTDSRCYDIQSSKEKGADLVEIVCPYHMIIDGLWKSVENDAKNITETCMRSSINMRYVIDYNSMLIPTEKDMERLCKIVQDNGIKNICGSLGYFNHPAEDTKDEVLALRDLKKRTAAKLLKAFVNTRTPEDLGIYRKAGVETISLLWKHAANLVHGFNNSIQNEAEED